MAMTFADLRQELLDRGFTYLSDNTISQARRDRWINQGYQDINDLERWPWLETTTTGVGTVTITDLRQVIDVTTSNGLLERRLPEALADSPDPLLTQTGTPLYWWQDGTSTIRVYPLSAGTTITVRYLKVPPDLVATTDVPVLPGRYHNLIVDFAAMRALRDRSNFQEAQAIWDALQPDLARMRDALPVPREQRQTDPAPA